MVLCVEGVCVDMLVTAANLISTYPRLENAGRRFCNLKPQVVGPAGLLHLFARESAVTHPHDRRIAVLAADDVTTAHVIVVRHTGSGAIGMCHLDRIDEPGITSLLDRLTSLSFHFEGRLEIHVFGGFVDSNHIGPRASETLLQCLQRQSAELELVHWCVGALFTVQEQRASWPNVYGVAVDIRTGDIFPASCLDKGPDLDIRMARTLAAGDNASVLEVYDCSREELRVGPFSYEPVRSASLLLAQSDDFLVQNLSSTPSVAPPLFVQQLRSTLLRMKRDPYPSVTLFPNNVSRVYRKEESSGLWLRVNKEETHYTPQQQQQQLAQHQTLPLLPPMAHSPVYYSHHSSC